MSVLVVVVIFLVIILIFKLMGVVNEIEKAEEHVQTNNDKDSILND